LEKLNAYFVERGLPQRFFVHPDLPDVLVSPADGPRRVVPKDKAVYVDRFCAEAVLRGANVFAKGVMAITGGCLQCVFVPLSTAVAVECCAVVFGDIVSVFYIVDTAFQRHSIIEQGPALETLPDGSVRATLAQFPRASLAFVGNGILKMVRCVALLTSSAHTGLPP